MKNTIFNIQFILLIYIFIAQSTKAQDPVAEWNFDQLNDNGVYNKLGISGDSLTGYWESETGVRGKCLRLDGYTTRLISDSDVVPKFTDAITIECWLALQSLPWNNSAIVSQAIQPASDKIETNLERGGPDGPSKLAYEDHIFFGVDAHGYPVFRLNLNGILYDCISEIALPLLKWNYLAATYQAGEGMKIYINGDEVAWTEADADFIDVPLTDMFIGMNTNNLGPEGSERQASAEIGSRMVLHGLLDELKIYDHAIPVETVAMNFRRNYPEVFQPLQWNQLPSGPAELPKQFGAFYTRLKYTEEWESQWKVGGVPDILVHFDRLPVRFIFWRGTGYGGVWVTENGIWMADQSLERSNAGKSPMGCSEHMSDKQARFSHVRIIEKNSARLVIHWRYAISDILYDIFGIDEENPRGEWADEYYYIYPDGITVRHQVLWSDYLSHEWQETIVINQPGTSPDDNIELEAMTLLNMKGERKSYSWRNGGPESFPDPAHANIQMVNLQSEYKPFIIFESDPGIRPFNPGTIRSEYAHFPWWNHWPVAQLPNDGRKAFGPDRPSHSSLSQAVEGTGVIHKREDGAYEVITLIGMTDQPADSLVSLARSWNYSPELKLFSNGYINRFFSKQERAYLIEKVQENVDTLKFNIQAGRGSPLVNPCFVIKNWNRNNIEINMNGANLSSKNYRYSYRNTTKGFDLIIWTDLTTEKLTEFAIIPTMDKRVENGDFYSF